MGGADNLTDAIFHLLKAPEYVVRAPRAWASRDHCKSRTKSHRGSQETSL